MKRPGSGKGTGHLIPDELLDELLERYAKEHGYKIEKPREGGSTMAQHSKSDWANNRAIGHPGPAKSGQDRVLTTAPAPKKTGVLRRLANIAKTITPKKRNR